MKKSTATITFDGERLYIMQVFQKTHLTIRLLICLCFILLMCGDVRCNAEKKIIIATGQYLLGDGIGESVSLAKERAKADAVRAAVEKAGIYVESYSVSENMQIVEDEVRFVAGNILDILEEKNEIIKLDNSITQYKSTIRVAVDIGNALQKLREMDREEINKNIKSYNALLKRSKELSDENVVLTKQYTAAMWDEGTKRQKLKLLNQNEKNYEANQLLLKAISLMEQGDYDNSFLCVNDALKKSDYEIAYMLRGNIYMEKGTLNKAISDYSHVISRNSYFADAYYRRGLCYDMAGMKEAALQDYDKAVSFDIFSVKLYANRGKINMEKKNYAVAISDTKKALSIGYGTAELHIQLGALYCLTGNPHSAIQELSVAGDVVGMNERNYEQWRYWWNMSINQLSPLDREKIISKRKEWNYFRKDRVVRLP